MRCNNYLEITGKMTRTKRMMHRPLARELTLCDLGIDTRSTIFITRSPGLQEYVAESLDSRLVAATTRRP